MKNPNHIKSSNTNPAIEQNTSSQSEKINPKLSDAANALSDIFAGLLPQTQGEDYEEEAFARKIKKKSKGFRR